MSVSFAERAKFIKEVISPQECAKLLDENQCRMAASWRDSTDRNISVLDKGFYDHVNNELFDIIDLVERFFGMSNIEALDWLEGTSGHVNNRRAKSETRASQVKKKKSTMRITDRYRYSHRSPTRPGEYHQLQLTCRYEFTFDKKPRHRESHLWCPKCKKKEVRQEHRQDDGWYTGLGQVERIPFKLDKWGGGEWVIITEGCKDALTIWTWGLPATSFCCGAGKWRPEYGRWFDRKKVVICLDNDAPGLKQLDIAWHLRGIAEFCRVIVPYKPVCKDDEGNGGDVTDWAMFQGGSGDLLQVMIARASDFRPMRLGDYNYI